MQFSVSQLADCFSIVLGLIAPSPSPLGPRDHGGHIPANGASGQIGDEIGRGRNPIVAKYLIQLKTGRAEEAE